MQRSCAFCQSSHWSTKRTAYTSVTQRLNRVRNLKLCFACLQSGHHATSCPSGAKLCKFCSTGSHHRSLCRRATKQSTDIRANFTHQVKKRVNTADVLLNARSVCPPKNETICFCDASTFHQFGRQLRPEVQMIETPMFTSADATIFVCGYCPTAEVKRVIFWFSSDQASLSHAELVRLVTELSHYYATHFETMMQYVVVPSSVSSRQDVWAYGIFKYLVPAQVFLLPDTQTTMPAHDLHAQDANNQQAVVESVKHRLREEHQLDLWSYYYADHSNTTATTVALGRTVQLEATQSQEAAVSPTLTSSSDTPTAPMLAPIFEHSAKGKFTEPRLVQGAADNAAPETSLVSAIIAEQNPNTTDCVPDTEATTDASASLKPAATPDAVSSSANDALAIAPVANLHRQRGYSNRRRRRRDQGPALQAHGLVSRNELRVAITEQGP